MKNLTLAVVGIVALAVAAVTFLEKPGPRSESEQPWHTYDSGIGSFSVEFPDRPKSREHVEDFGTFQTNAELTSYEQKDGAYLTMVSVFPDNFGERDARTILFATRDGMIEGSNAGMVLDSSEEIEIDGHPGLELHALGMAGPHKPAFMRARIFIVANRVHQNLFTGERGKTPESVVSRFLDSFELSEASDEASEAPETEQ